MQKNVSSKAQFGVCTCFYMIVLYDEITEIRRRKNDSGELYELEDFSVLIKLDFEHARLRFL